MLKHYLYTVLILHIGICVLWVLPILAVKYMEDNNLHPAYIFIPMAIIVLLIYI